MLTWDESMSTGIALIDSQHKMIFQKFNEFSEAISGGASQEAAAEILDFLQFYANWHFGREEKCMAEYHCPAAAQNKQAHAEFLVTFNGFYEQWQNGTMTPALVSKTHQELENWLLNHIGRTDTQLRPCVEKSAGARGLSN
jgi:hemerythrin